jgi:DNA-directed RNA polymerase subunit RPC12/RpoP
MSEQTDQRWIETVQHHKARVKELNEEIESLEAIVHSQGETIRGADWQYVYFNGNHIKPLHVAGYKCSTCDRRCLANTDDFMKDFRYQCPSCSHQRELRTGSPIRSTEDRSIDVVDLTASCVVLFRCPHRDTTAYEFKDDYASKDKARKFAQEAQKMWFHNAEILDPTIGYSKYLI